MSIRRFLDIAQQVEPEETPAIVAEDPQDDKLLAAADAARFHALITNDGHLLRYDPYQGIRIVQPSVFLQIWSH